MLKIKDNSNSQFRNPQIIQHQSTLVISDSIDHLGMHDNRIKGDQVGNKETNLVSFMKDIKHSLLLEWNLSQVKLDCQRIFVWFLEEPRPSALRTSIAEPTI